MPRSTNDEYDGFVRARHRNWPLKKAMIGQSRIIESNKRQRQIAMTGYDVKETPAMWIDSVTKSWTRALHLCVTVLHIISKIKYIKYSIIVHKIRTIWNRIMQIKHNYRYLLRSTKPVIGLSGWVLQSRSVLIIDGAAQCSHPVRL